MSARAFGRSLGDFTPLLPAEKELLIACRTGEECVVGGNRPTERTKSNTIRAGFLRFLILGGDDENPVHEKGVQLLGAWIDGVLDMEGGVGRGDVALINCWFEKQPIFRAARVNGTLVLDGSYMPGLQADLIQTDDGIFLRNGFESVGEVWLMGAKIGGDLSCVGANITAGEYGRALSADGIRVEGSIFLTGTKIPTGTDSKEIRFKAVGEVRFPGAKVGGDLSCHDADFIAGKTDVALTVDGIQVGRNLYLKNGFKAQGEVRLIGAKIGGNFECDGGDFSGIRKGILTGDALYADNIEVGKAVFLRSDFTVKGDISFQSASIGGNLDCKKADISENNRFSLENIDVKGTLILRTCEVINNILLSGARVGMLEDDEQSWGAGLNLHHFTYDKISDASPMTADMRIAWLGKQAPMLLGKGEGSVLAPQPWLRLKKVLKEAGYYEEARQVGVELEKRKSAYNRRNTWLFRWVCSLCCCGEETKSSSKATPLFLWLLNWLYGLFTGFGYRPIRLLYISFFVWLLCFRFYALTAHKGEFAPSDMKVVCGYYDHCAPGAVAAASMKAKPDWLNGNILPPEYTDFESGMYSLNVLVPVLDLQQESAWSPYVAPNSWLMESWGGWAQILVWLETCYGWLAGAMLLTVLSGLTRKQEEE